jgi:hypothetical protein
VTNGRMLLVVPLLRCQPHTRPTQSPIRRLPILLRYPIMALQSCIKKIRSGCVEA